MRPANAKQAQQQMRKLLGRKISGRRATKVKEHTKRALQIADVLYRQFQVGPYQYRQKHLQWYLNTYTKPLASTTKYRYRLTIQLIIKVLDYRATARSPLTEISIKNARYKITGNRLKKHSRIVSSVL